MQIRFNDIDVPKERLEQVVNQNIYEIKMQHKKKKHWNYVIRGTAAAAAVLALTGIFASNPTFAAKLPLVGHIFERVQDEQNYPGNFDEVAEPVADKNVSEDQGIKITLSEIYSDSRAMYVSAMVESKDPFPEAVKTSNILYGDDIGYRIQLGIEQELDFMTPPKTYDPLEWPGDEYTWTPLELKGEYTDEHTFVGAMRISFHVAPIALFDVPDTFRWKLHINSLNVSTDQGVAFSKEGSWDFETSVSIDHSKVKILDINESTPKGDIIKSVTMTPYEVFVDTRYDESKVEPGYERYDSLRYVMLDADGTYIEDSVGTFSPAYYNMSRLTFYACPTFTEEAHDELSEKLHDESFKSQLPAYLNEHAVRKIEIDTGDYYK